METMTVKEVIDALQKYPNDMEVWYSTKYALVPLSVRVLEEDHLVMDMSDEAKDLFKTEY